MSKLVSELKEFWNTNKFARRVTFIFLDSALAAPLGNLLDITTWKAMLLAGLVAVFHFIRKAVSDARAQEGV